MALTHSFQRTVASAFSTSSGTVHSDPIAAAFKSHKNEIFRAAGTITSAMGHVSVGDACQTISYASHFALGCLASFGFGFGAGYVYAGYRNYSKNEGECQIKSDGALLHAKPYESLSLLSQIVARDEPFESPNSKLVCTRTPGNPSKHASPALLPPRGNSKILLSKIRHPQLSHQNSLSLEDSEFEGGLGVFQNCPTENLREKRGIDSEGLENLLKVEKTGSEECDGEDEIMSASPIKSHAMSSKVDHHLVSELFIHSIRGCASQSVTSLPITRSGVEHHLVYAVSEFTGRIISNQKAPSLLKVTPKIVEKGKLLIETPDMAAVIHEHRGWGETKVAVMNGVKYEAVDQGDASAKFFSSFLEIPGARLLFIRPPPEINTNLRSNELWFDADRPLLITSEGFAKEHCNATGSKPNIIFSGSQPEGNWNQVRIGDHIFEVVRVVDKASQGDRPKNFDRGILINDSVLIPKEIGKNTWVIRIGQGVQFIRNEPPGSS